MNKDLIQELTENSKLLELLKPLFEKAMSLEQKSPAALINYLSYAIVQRKARELDEITQPFAEQCYLETLTRITEDIPAGKKVIEVEVSEAQEAARVRVGDMEFIVMVKGRVRRLVEKEPGAKKRKKPKLKLIRGGANR